MLVSAVYSLNIISEILNIGKNITSAVEENAEKLLNYTEGVVLNFTTLTKQNGYSSEKYEVTTEDGYILNLYRMSSEKCDNLIQPPILLMHGFILNSDIWLDAGRNASLAYMLADNCYDLWIGNIRGTYQGRRHVTLDPDTDHEFWDFCMDDNGYYDIPAQIDMVLNVTQAEKINYIGYSQGCAEMSIACAERQEYCDKVQLFIAMAPALRMKNTRSLLMRAASEVVQALDSLLTELKIYEIFAKGSIVQEVLQILCKSTLAEPLCQGLIAAADAYDPGSLSSATIKRMYTHIPAGTSKKSILKYAQAFGDEYFSKYDYGSEKNLKVYGTEKAPQFALSNMTIPTVIIGGLGDYIVDLKDMQWLQEQLPNVLELKMVNYSLWNHFDVSYSSFAPTLLFPTVRQYLEQYSNSTTK